MHLTRLEKTQNGSSTKVGPVFVSAMETALHLCDWTDITLHAPYLHLTKADIVKIGTRLGVDYSLTWTCYKGDARPCGKCGACTRGSRR